MKWLVVLALLLLQPEPPRLYVVAARDTVMPGDTFTVTVLAFGDVGDVQFDPGSFTVLTDTLGLPSRHITMRASGPPRDVRVRAWGGGRESSTVVRICCRAGDTPRVYLPVLRSEKAPTQRVYLPALRA